MLGWGVGKVRGTCGRSGEWRSGRGGTGGRGPVVVVEPGRVGRRVFEGVVEDLLLPRVLPHEQTFSLPHRSPSPDLSLLVEDGVLPTVSSRTG